MPRILHVADLHLTPAGQERDYSLAVLGEAVEQAAALQVDALLITGHLVDSAADLGSALDAALDEVPCPTLCVAGACEQAALAREALGAITLLDTAPVALRTLGLGQEALELLAISPRAVLTDWPSWAVPPKRTAHRVVMAHAAVASIPCEHDAMRRALDPALFGQFKADYAALGGAHQAPAPARIGSTLVAYPGAARVTAQQERGARTALLVELGDEVTTVSVPLARAGRYQKLDLWVNGRLPDAIGAETWSEHDWIDLHLTGVVADAAAAEALAREATERWGHRARRLRVETRALALISNAVTASLAQRLRDTLGAGAACDLGMRLLGEQIQAAS